MYRSFCFKSFGLFKSWSERLFNVFVACLCRDQTSDVKFSFPKTLTAEAEKLFKNEAFLSVIPAKMLHCWNNDEKINCNGWKACGVFVVSTFSFPLYIFMEISSKHRTRTKLPLVSLFFFSFSQRITLTLNKDLPPDVFCEYLSEKQRANTGGCGETQQD